MKTTSTKKTEFINIVPDKSLLPKLGSAGYSVPQAIAELVDNSIDAKHISDDKSQMLVNIKIDSKKIVIADTGIGMDRTGISNAFKLAHSIKQNKLGEFGLGMKTACLSLGRKFTVMTKMKNESKLYTIIFDSTAWSKSGTDWKIALTEEDHDIDEHFTIVEVEELKVFYPNLTHYIRDDLSKRYSPYIRNKEVIIKVNGETIKNQDIEIDKETYKEFSIDVGNGNSVHGWYGLMRESSQKGNYGFSTFRRNRMITAYDKIGFKAHPTLARIIGELHMDHVPVQHSKRGFETESSEYRKVCQVMEIELKELIIEARKRKAVDSITEDIKTEVKIWQEKISEVLRGVEFDPYTKKIGEDKELEDESEDIDDLDIEKRNPKLNEVIKKNKEIEEKKRERNPNITHPDKRSVIKIRGKNIYFEHFFYPLGKESKWKEFSYSKEKGLEVYTNIDFPAYIATTDKSFYAVIHIAESIAELFNEIINDNQFTNEEIREMILRKASLCKEQIED